MTSAIQNGLLVARHGIKRILNVTAVVNMDIIDMNALVKISGYPGDRLVGITAHPVTDIRDLVKYFKISIFSIYLSIFVEFLWKLIFSCLSTT